MHNTKKLWGHPFIKREWTIVKAPNFHEILFNTWKGLSQNFNVIAFFALELGRHQHNTKNLWKCSFIKREWTIEKAPNFQEIFLNTRTSLSQNFNVIAFFVLELFRPTQHKKRVRRCPYKLCFRLGLCLGFRLRLKLRPQP